MGRAGRTKQHGICLSYPFDCLLRKGIPIFFNRLPSRIHLKKIQGKLLRHLLHGFDDDLCGFDDIPSDSITGDNSNFVSFLFHERPLKTGAASAFLRLDHKELLGGLMQTLRVLGFKGHEIFTDIGKCGR